MNKNISLFFAVLMVSIFFTACSSSEKGGSDEGTTPDLEAQVQEVSSTSEATPFDAQQEEFHTYMAGTFHPAEEDDLAPLREQHADMVEAAKTWKATDIPAKYADKGLEEQLAKLVSGAEAISQMVNDGAEDQELKTAIYDLHDVFHDIMGACQDAGEHGMHEHHHKNEKEHDHHHKKGGKH